MHIKDKQWVKSSFRISASKLKNMHGVVLKANSKERERETRPTWNQYIYLSLSLSLFFPLSKTHTHTLPVRTRISKTSLCVCVCVCVCVCGCVWTNPRGSHARQQATWKPPPSKKSSSKLPTLSPSSLFNGVLSQFFSTFR